MSLTYYVPVILVIASDIYKISFFKKSYKRVYHFLERTEGKYGLGLAKNTVVNLMIIDSKIPDMAIFDLCRAIRKIPSYLETPILLITNNITNNLKKIFMQQALQAGASDFLNEPLDKNEIDQRLAVSFSKLYRERGVFTSTPKPPLLPPDEETSLEDKAFQAFIKICQTTPLVNILFIELDGLKKMKKTIAEKSLLQLISVLHHHLRKYDILIPSHSGQCLILLPNTSEETAHVMGETMREAVTEIIFENPLSVSIRLLTLNKASPPLTTIQDFAQLIDRVSKAADQAKKTSNAIVITSLDHL